MEKKCFITDFDRTLLTDDKMISQQDFATLEALKKKNIVTVIATGRSVYSFEKALFDLGLSAGCNCLPVDYVIFSTGAGIIEFPGGDLIYQKSITSSGINQIVTYFNRYKIDYMVHKAIPDTQYFLYKIHGHDNPDFHARMALYQDYAAPLKNADDVFEPATEVLAVIPGKSNLDAVEIIKKELSGFSVIHATSPLDHMSAWVEVFHQEVSKSSTASWLIKKLNIRRENVISVGNDYNDEDLLDWSGKGFVVNNAPQRLQQRFETVPSNNQGGVTAAVKRSGLLG